MFLAVMAGFGIECTFVMTMFLIRALCVFCVTNSVIVVVLTIFTLDVGSAWQAVAAAVVAFGASLALIYLENRQRFSKPSKEKALSEIEEETEEGLNPAIGPEDATVTVIEFSDYLCPICRKSRAMVNRIRDEFKGKICWVYMDFPLEMHEGAKELARAPRCAGDQGKFWQYQELLLGAQGRPAPRDLEGFAAKLGLDVGRFRDCLAGTNHGDEIERDIAEGVEAGVSATPTFLVNGKAHVAPSYEELRRAIVRALDSQRLEKR
jgi:protein-disulfide isomerase